MSFYCFHYHHHFHQYCITTSSETSEFWVFLPRYITLPTLTSPAILTSFCRGAAETPSKIFWCHRTRVGNNLFSKGMRNHRPRWMVGASLSSGCFFSLVCDFSCLLPVSWVSLEQLPWRVWITNKSLPYSYLKCWKDTVPRKLLAFAELWKGKQPEWTPTCCLSKFRDSKLLPLNKSHNLLWSSDSVNRDLNLSNLISGLGLSLTWF